MAKDRRNKTRPTLNLEATDASTNDRAKSPSRPTTPPRRETTRPASSNTASVQRRKKKRKRLSRAALIMRWVLAVMVLSLLVFIGLAGYWVYDEFIAVGNTVKVDPIAPNEYDTTPVGQQNDVAYYLVGVLGEEETSDTAMLSMVCHHKKTNKVNVLQLPTATAIEKGEDYTVNTLGSVFANPKPLEWCNTCAKQLYEPEITRGEPDTHAECGTAITKKKGSAVGGVIDIINDQLALPVDEYFLFPQKGLAYLIDKVNGVDVHMSGENELAGTSYAAGVQTLNGAAAVEYMTSTDGSATDSTRLIRQNEVFAALLTRLFKLDDESLRSVFVKLMDSEWPLRTECIDRSDEDYPTASAVLNIFKSVKPAGVAGFSVQTLPGEATVSGDEAVYSAHKQELLNVLNAGFAATGKSFVITDLLIPELANSNPSNSTVKTLDVFLNVDGNGEATNALKAQAGVVVKEAEEASE